MYNLAPILLTSSYTYNGQTFFHPWLDSDGDVRQLVNLAMLTVASNYMGIRSGAGWGLVCTPCAPHLGEKGGVGINS